MSKIPEHYQWILNIADSPKMIQEALKLVGIQEYPGKMSNNPLIMGMAKDLAIPASLYPNDETAWCALSHSWICFKTGKPLPLSGSGVDLLRARSFLKWGVVAPVPMFGDTLVFNRPGGYHVGIYAAEDITHYHVLGGNQANSYGFTRLDKKRLVGARRYYSIAAPASVRVYTVSPVGQISNNEV